MNISMRLGTQRGAWHTTNMMVMAIDARVIRPSRFRSVVPPVRLSSSRVGMTVKLAVKEPHASSGKLGGDSIDF